MRVTTCEFRATSASDRKHDLDTRVDTLLRHVSELKGRVTETSAALIRSRSPSMNNELANCPRDFDQRPAARMEVSAAQWH